MTGFIRATSTVMAASCTGGRPLPLCSLRFPSPPLGCRVRTALPEIVLACAATLLLLLGVVRGEGSTRLVSWLSVLVLLGILVLAARLGLDRRIGFYGMFVTDAFALFMKALVLIGSAVSIVMA